MLVYERDDITVQGMQVGKEVVEQPASICQERRGVDKRNSALCGGCGVVSNGRGFGLACDGVNEEEGQWCWMSLGVDNGEPRTCAEVRSG